MLIMLLLVFLICSITSSISLGQQNRIRLGPWVGDGLAACLTVKLERSLLCCSSQSWILGNWIISLAVVCFREGTADKSDLLSSSVYECVLQELNNLLSWYISEVPQLKHWIYTVTSCCSFEFQIYPSFKYKYMAYFTIIIIIYFPVKMSFIGSD